MFQVQLTISGTIYMYCIDTVDCQSNFRSKGGNVQLTISGMIYIYCIDTVDCQSNFRSKGGNV